VKRLASLATTMQPHQAVATLAVVRHILQRYPRATQLLDAEVATDGVYMPFVGDPEHCNALAGTLWEGVLLATHWHPTLAKHARELLAGKSTLLRSDVTLQALRELVHSLDTLSRATFAPPVRVPSAHAQKRSNAAHASLARTGKFNFRQQAQSSSSSSLRIAVPRHESAEHPLKLSASSFERTFINCTLRSQLLRSRQLLLAWRRSRSKKTINFQQ
jgi:hypothetical protein